MTLSTKEKLAWSAARLFQERGFHGVGLAEILKESGLPKGSLYHHFPDGKTDLALEAAALAHRETSRIIEEAFKEADTFESGATTLFYKLAKLFEIMGKHTACPISEILFGGPDNQVFRERSADYFEAWISQIAGQAERLGETPDAARAHAERTFLILQGGWILARAKQDGNVIRTLSELLFRD